MEDSKRRKEEKPSVSNTIFSSSFHISLSWEHSSPDPLATSWYFILQCVMSWALYNLTRQSSHIFMPTPFPSDGLSSVRVIFDFLFFCWFYFCFFFSLNFNESVFAKKKTMYYPIQESDGEKSDQEIIVDISIDVVSIHSAERQLKKA